MILNFEETKNKFGIGFQVNPFDNNTINEIFLNGSSEYFSLDEILNKRLLLKREAVEHQKGQLQALIKIYDRMSFLDLLKHKSEIKTTKENLISLENFNFEDFNKDIVINNIDQQHCYEVDLPDMNTNNVLFKVSIVSLHVFQLKIEKIKYYLINNNRFKISIYCSSEDGDDLIELSREGKLTNFKIYDHIFISKPEADNFLKKHVIEKIQYYEEKLKDLN